MNEIKSPNVKKIIPLQIAEVITSHDPEKFTIIDHDRGIFEFNYDCMINQPSIELAARMDFNRHKTSDCLYEVDVTGIKSDYGVGSERFCTMNKKLSEWLSKVIVGNSVVDFIPGHEIIGVSKYFRFMRYKSGGEHFPHYDSDFVHPFDPNKVTKYSLVMYFTDCDSGEFAFVKDNRKDHGNKDWQIQAKEDQIELKILPKALKILIFPHTLCHTVLPFTDKNKERIIVRGDIYFETK